MDQTTKQVMQKTLTEIGISLEKGNYDHSSDLATSIIEFSLMTDSEMGVFAGEVLEAVIMEYGLLLREYNISNSEKTTQNCEVLLLIDQIKSSISSDDDQSIYNALSKLRLYVTKQQKSFPLQYKHRNKRRSPY